MVRKLKIGAVWAVPVTAALAAGAVEIARGESVYALDVAVGVFFMAVLAMGVVTSVVTGDYL